MFNSIRILSTIIAAVILLLSFLGGQYIKDYAINHLIKEPLTEMALTIQTPYDQKVWHRYQPLIEHLAKTPQNQWASIAQYHTFYQTSKEYLWNRSIIKVRILTPQNQTLFLSNNKLVLAEPDENYDEVLAHIDSQGNNEILYSKINREVYTQNGVKHHQHLLSVYSTLNTLPVQGDDEYSARNRYILEFHFDIDKAYDALIKFQYIITFLISLILALTTALIIFSTRKVEALIDQQERSSVELANAKLLAESESKAKTQFLANISHELRTPLNAIIGFSEIISSESMGPLNNEKYKEFVLDIHASGIHLLSLINDILDFSKAEENKLEVDFEPVDITKTIKVCLRMLLPRAEAAKVKVIDEVPAQHLIIQADPKRIKQVVLNLLSNAVKFTPEGGQVNIKVWQDSQSVVLEIKDSGVGMAAQDLAKALSPFGQVENKLSKRFEGTGLGLPLTKKLVDLMKGKFDIQSEPGLGTTITISFALESDDVAN